MKILGYINLLLFTCCLCIASCKEELKQMQVVTGTVTNIQKYSADISGKILDLGNGGTQYGHCYSTTPNPTITDGKTELGIPIIGDFISPLIGLTFNTKYYVKAYCSRGNEIVYGEEISFTTTPDDEQAPPGGGPPRN